MSTQPLTAVRVQQILREVDAELAGGKLTSEALCRLLKRLDAANIPNFHTVSCTSPLSGRRLLVSQLVYQLEALLETAEEQERESLRAAKSHGA